MKPWGYTKWIEWREADKGQGGRREDLRPAQFQ